MAEGAGHAQDIASKITEITSLDARSVVLGHVQRGGRPTAVSRDLALRLGQAAVDCLLEGRHDRVVGFKCGKIIEVDFLTAIKKKELKADYWYSLIKTLT